MLVRAVQFWPLADNSWAATRRLDRETYYRQPSTLEILAGEGPCLDTARLGVIFLHGQEGDQFPKTDRAFCDLDVRRMPAAAAFSRSLRLEGFLRQRIHAITLLSCRSILDQRGRIRTARVTSGLPTVWELPPSSTITSAFIATNQLMASD